MPASKNLRGNSRNKPRFATTKPRLDGPGGHPRGSGGLIARRGLASFAGSLALLLMVALLFAGQTDRAAAGALPPPQFESSSQSVVTSATGNGITIDKPTGTIDGDLLIAAIVHSPSGNIVAPSGWTEFNSGGCDNFECSLAVWYKVASGEPADYTFTRGGARGANKTAGGILRYSGADPANPIGVSDAATGNSINPEAPSISTTVDNTTILRIAAIGDGNFASDPLPTGHAFLFDVIEAPGSTPSLAAAGTTKATPGSTSIAAFALETAESWRAVTIAINPEGATLAVTISGTGSGAVTSELSGIDCPGNCTQTYTLGTTVALTATADNGSTFTGWAGAGTGDAPGGRSVTMDGNKSVTATFTIDTQTLNISVVGSGTVTSDVGTIDCPNVDCDSDYAVNTVVTLAATPATGWLFTGWDGAITGSANPETVTMSANKSVTATFSQPTVPPNEAPDVFIISPGFDDTVAVFFTTDSIAFSGGALDLEDGILSGVSLFWESSINGDLNTGESFSATLSIGDHVITLTATDSEGLDGFKNRSIIVTAPPQALIAFAPLPVPAPVPNADSISAPTPTPTSTSTPTTTPEPTAIPVPTPTATPVPVATPTTLPAATVESQPTATPTVGVASAASGSEATALSPSTPPPGEGGGGGGGGGAGGVGGNGDRSASDGGSGGAALPAGAIGGIIAGVIAIMSLLIYFDVKRKRSQLAQPDPLSG